MAAHLNQPGRHSGQRVPAQGVLAGDLPPNLDPPGGGAGESDDGAISACGGCFLFCCFAAGPIWKVVLSHLFGTNFSHTECRSSCETHFPSLFIFFLIFPRDIQLYFHTGLPYSVALWDSFATFVLSRLSSDDVARLRRAVKTVYATDWGCVC
jgi:hypothetical protein